MVVVAACGDPGGVRPARPYRLTELRSFGGDEYRSIAYALGADGVAVGIAEGLYPGDVPALWRGATPAPIYPEGRCHVGQGCDGIAYDVNARGEVVGMAGLVDENGRAWLWRDGQLIDIGALAAPGFSVAKGINDLGEIVGIVGFPGTVGHAALWRGGALTDLGTLAAGTHSEALAINNHSHVAGWSRINGSVPPRHAFLLRDGRMIDLGTLGREESIAHDVNDADQVVGWLGELHDRHAFLWENGALRLLSGAEYSTATAINSGGDVVGFYLPTGGAALHAALWRDGRRLDLNEMTGDGTLILTVAHDINDAGQILAVGVRGDHAVTYLLTPTTP